MSRNVEAHQKKKAHAADVNRSVFAGFLQNRSSSTSTNPNPLACPDDITCSHPCGGLTSERYPQISIYLMRSQAVGGGARPRKDIVHQLFGEDVKWGDLNERQKLRVERTEAIEFQWLNFREQGFVLSATCLKNSSSKDPAQSCSECSNLLKNKVFKNTLQWKLPKEENLRYTPLAYHTKMSGEQYTKMVGVHDIVRKVTNVRWLVYLFEVI